MCERRRVWWCFAEKVFETLILRPFLITKSYIQQPRAGSSLALNRRFKEPRRDAYSRWQGRGARGPHVIRDSEQVKTGVYDTFVFHGTGPLSGIARSRFYNNIVPFVYYGIVLVRTPPRKACLVQSLRSAHRVYVCAISIPESE